MSALYRLHYIPKTKRDFRKVLQLADADVFLLYVFAQGLIMKKYYTTILVLGFMVDQSFFGGF